MDLPVQKFAGKKALFRMKRGRVQSVEKVRIFPGFFILAL